VRNLRENSAGSNSNTGSFIELSVLTPNPANPEGHGLKVDAYSHFYSSIMVNDQDWDHPVESFFDITYQLSLSTSRYPSDLPSFPVDDVSSGKLIRSSHLISVYSELLSSTSGSGFNVDSFFDVSVDRPNCEFNDPDCDDPGHSVPNPAVNIKSGLMMDFGTGTGGSGQDDGSGGSVGSFALGWLVHFAGDLNAHGLAGLTQTRFEVENTVSGTPDAITSVGTQIMNLGPNSITLWSSTTVNESGENDSDKSDDDSGGSGADKFMLSNMFKVEIDGITEAHFREIEGLATHIEVLEYQEGGENSKTLRSTSSRLSLEFVIRQDDVSNDDPNLINWMELSLETSFETRTDVIHADNEEYESIYRARINSSFVLNTDYSQDQEQDADELRLTSGLTIGIDEIKEGGLNSHVHKFAKRVSYSSIGSGGGEPEENTKITSSFTHKFEYNTLGQITTEIIINLEVDPPELPGGQAVFDSFFDVYVEFDTEDDVNPAIMRMNTTLELVAQRGGGDSSIIDLDINVSLKSGPLESGENVEEDIDSIHVWMETKTLGDYYNTGSGVGDNSELFNLRFTNDIILGPYGLDGEIALKEDIYINLKAFAGGSGGSNFAIESFFDVSFELDPDEDERAFVRINNSLEITASESNSDDPDNRLDWLLRLEVDLQGNVGLVPADGSGRIFASVSVESSSGGGGFLNELNVNVKTPDEAYKVKVKFPWIRDSDDDSETFWARIGVFMGGGDRGFFVLPEVGDEVLVAFVEGDPRNPIITGALYNGNDKPPSGTVDVTIENKTGLIRNTHLYADDNDLVFWDRTEQVQIEGLESMNISVKIPDFEAGKTPEVDVKVDLETSGKSKFFTRVEQKITLTEKDVILETNVTLVIKIYESYTDPETGRTETKQVGEKDITLLSQNDGKNNARFMHSRSGHLLLFDDGG
jgi:phage tail-like protein